MRMSKGIDSCRLQMHMSTTLDGTSSYTKFLARYIQQSKAHMQLDGKKVTEQPIVYMLDTAAAFHKPVSMCEYIGQLHLVELQSRLIYRAASRGCISYIYSSCISYIYTQSLHLVYIGIQELHLAYIQQQLHLIYGRLVRAPGRRLND